MNRVLVIFSTASLLCACAGGPAPEDQAFVAMRALAPAATDQGVSPAYRIGPLDLLSVRVFRVEDLSFDELRVDAEGQIEFPLIGTVQAAGMTPAGLAEQIRAKLAESYLQDPQVTVAVSEASSQKVTIDGAVTEPGSYEMKGRTTLIQAVAMAKGATRVADLRRVAVFRTVDEMPMVAVFDLAAIRAGRVADPVLEGDDIVVVDASRMSMLYRDAIAALPALGVFRPY